jgi:hypothetical protein
MTQTATGGTATDQAREKAQEIGTQAKEKAQEAGTEARSRVRDEVDRRSTQAGDQAGATAQALRDASGRLREDGNEPVARGIERVADGVERAGGWLRDSDGDSILRDIEDFGRRNTLAVVAGGLALGFAASRLLKASSRRRYESGTATRYAGNGAPATRATPSPTPSATMSPSPAAATSPSPGTTTSPPTTSRPGSEPPREGITEAGLSGGTPATSPPSWQGGLGSEGEGARRS